MDMDTFKSICTVIVCAEALAVFGVGVVGIYALIAQGR